MTSEGHLWHTRPKSKANEYSESPSTPIGSFRTLNTLTHLEYLSLNTHNNADQKIPQPNYETPSLLSYNKQREVKDKLKNKIRSKLQFDTPKSTKDVLHAFLKREKSDVCECLQQSSLEGQNMNIRKNHRDQSTVRTIYFTPNMDSLCTEGRPNRNIKTPKLYDQHDGWVNPASSISVSTDCSSISPDMCDQQINLKTEIIAPNSAANSEILCNVSQIIQETSKPDTPNREFLMKSAYERMNDPHILSGKISNSEQDPIIVDVVSLAPFMIKAETDIDTNDERETIGMGLSQSSEVDDDDSTCTSEREEPPVIHQRRKKSTKDQATSPILVKYGQPAGNLKYIFRNCGNSYTIEKPKAECNHCHRENQSTRPKRKSSISTQTDLKQGSVSTIRYSNSAHANNLQKVSSVTVQTQPLHERDCAHVMSCKLQYRTVADVKDGSTLTVLDATHCQKCGAIFPFVPECYCQREEKHLSKSSNDHVYPVTGTVIEIPCSVPINKENTTTEKIGTKKQKTSKKVNITKTERSQIISDAEHTSTQNPKVIKINLTRFDLSKSQSGMFVKTHDTKSIHSTLNSRTMSVKQEDSSPPIKRVKLDLTLPNDPPKQRVSQPSLSPTVTHQSRFTSPLLSAMFKECKENCRPETTTVFANRKRPRDNTIASKEQSLEYKPAALPGVQPTPQVYTTKLLEHKPSSSIDDSTFLSKQLKSRMAKEKRTMVQQSVSSSRDPHVVKIVTDGQGEIKDWQVFQLSPVNNNDEDSEAVHPTTGNANIAINKKERNKILLVMRNDMSKQSDELR